MMRTVCTLGAITLCVWAYVDFNYAQDSALTLQKNKACIDEMGFVSRPQNKMETISLRARAWPVNQYVSYSRYKGCRLGPIDPPGWESNDDYCCYEAPAQLNNKKRGGAFCCVEPPDTDW